MYNKPIPCLICIKAAKKLIKGLKSDIFCKKWGWNLTFLQKGGCKLSKVFLTGFRIGILLSQGVEFGNFRRYGKSQNSLKSEPFLTFWFKFVFDVWYASTSSAVSSSMKSSLLELNLKYWWSSSIGSLKGFTIVGGSESHSRSIDLASNLLIGADSHQSEKQFRNRNYCSSSDSLNYSESEWLNQDSELINSNQNALRLLCFAISMYRHFHLQLQNRNWQIKSHNQKWFRNRNYFWFGIENL